jgi:hypothetical protein
MQDLNEIDKMELVRFKGVITREIVDSLLHKIETSIRNIKWIKSVLRVSYDLLTSGYGAGDIVEFALSNTAGTYSIYCKHNEVSKEAAGFIDKTINKLKDYDEDKLKDLIKRLTSRHSPITEKGTFFEDIIWSIYNIYRRKYANIKISCDFSEPAPEFIPVEFFVSFDFKS